MRTATFHFGNYDPSPLKEYNYVQTGRGRAITRGNILVVDDSALSRPPVGYYYATYLVKRDDSIDAALAQPIRADAGIRSDGASDPAGSAHRADRA